MKHHKSINISHKTIFSLQTVFYFYLVIFTGILLVIFISIILYEQWDITLFVFLITIAVCFVAYLWYWSKLNNVWYDQDKIVIENFKTKKYYSFEEFVGIGHAFGTSHFKIIFTDNTTYLFFKPFALLIFFDIFSSKSYNPISEMENMIKEKQGI